MSLSTLSGFGGGGVRQKFNPLRSKLVSDWVNTWEDKLTILLLRISSFVKHSLCLRSIRFLLLIVHFRSKVSASVFFNRALNAMFFVFASWEWASG